MDNNLLPIVFGLLVMGVAIAYSFYARKQDRVRISEQIESQGGKVIEIIKHWGGGFGGKYQRAYDVSYITSRGMHIKAMCLTSIGSGVCWVTDRPPSEGVPPSDDVL